MVAGFRGFWLTLFLVVSFMVFSTPVSAGGISECGNENEPCCPDAQCDFGFLECDSTNTCVFCGLLGEVCCQGLMCSGSDLVCDPGGGLCQNGNCAAGGGAQVVDPICVECGDDDQPCCEFESCNSGGECVNGVCEICGGDGQPCCPPFNCDPGSICVSVMTYEELAGHGAGDSEVPGTGSGGTVPEDICQPCGALDERCCSGDICEQGLICESTGTETAGVGGGAGNGIILDQCVNCGALGEACCPGSTCDTENLLCGGSVCEACGAVGEQCCADSTCPNSAAACIAGMCEALQAAPAMGPGVVLALLVTLLSFGALTLKRS